MSRTMVSVAVATALAASLIVAAGQPAAAGPGESDVPSAPPDMSAAMQRDLHLTAAQAQARMVTDDKAARTERRLRGELGTRFAGAWLTPDADQFVVAVTDASMAGRVRAAGAQPTIVTRTEAQLDALKARLDARANAAPASVTGWYVDVVSNKLVVTSNATSDSAAAFVAASGVDASAVRMEVSDETPRPLYDVRGGDSYYINRVKRCSVGFSVRGGFLTAGHCGSRGARTAGYNGVLQGTFGGSSFPGNDYAWVHVSSRWNPRSLVNRFHGRTVRVSGSHEAPVGAAVCKSGSTTGWRCGRIQARNVAVRYPQGIVTGLIRTNICSLGGDSGGPLIAGNQAQGITSGGSGSCTRGGTTYSQPVNEILSRYRLRLVTS